MAETLEDGPWTRYETGPWNDFAPAEQEQLREELKSARTKGKLLDVVQGVAEVASPLAEGALEALSFSPARIAGTIERGLGGAASAITGRPMEVRPELRISETLTRPITGRNIPQIPTTKDTPKVGQISAGLGNAVIDLANFMQTPEGIGFLGLGKLPQTVQKTVTTAMAGTMAAEYPHEFDAALESAQAGDLNAATKKIVSIPVMSALLTKHAAGSTKLPVVRRPAAEMGERLAKELDAAELEVPPEGTPGSRLAEPIVKTVERGPWDEFQQADARVVPPVPETPATIAAQMKLLQGGKRQAVLITEGEAMPEVPPNHLTTVTPAGTFIHKPDLKPENIQRAVQEDRIGQILDYGIERKPDPGNFQVVVVARDAEGVPVQSVVTDAAHLRAVMASAERAAGKEGTVTMEPAEKVIAEREANAPKLRQMENQGDLLSGQREDLALAAERGLDPDRVAREQAAAEQAAAERAAFEAKHQQDLIAKSAAEGKGASAAPGTITGLDAQTGAAMPAEGGSGPPRSAASSLSAAELTRQADLANAEQRLEVLRQRGKEQSLQAFRVRARIARLKQPIKPTQPAKRTRASDSESQRPPDLLDTIEEQMGGKISLESAREVDSEFRPVGAARKMFTTGRGGHALDIARQVAEGAGHAFESSSHFLESLNAAAQGRKTWRDKFYAQENALKLEARQATTFSRDAHKPGTGKQTLVPETLLAGEEFTIKGTKVRVKDFEFDVDGEVVAVILEDGPKYGTQRVAAGTAINVDSGSVKTAATAGKGAGNEPFSIQQATLPRRIESATGVPGMDPVALADIRKYLSEALDIPIFKRLGKGGISGTVRGIFKPGAETIRLRALNDVSTIAHEVGHYLHWILFPDSTARGRKYSQGGPSVPPASAFSGLFDGELLPLGRRTSRSTYSTEQVRWEGFAEYVRRWMTDRTDALARAPEFTRFFESELQGKFRETWAIIENARGLLGRYINQPAQMKVRSMISRTPEDRRVPLTERLQKFYTNWVNDLAPIERALDTLQKFGLPPALAKMVSDYAVNHIGGWRGKVEYNLWRRQTDLRGQDVGPGLREILKGVESLDDFSDFLVSKRALEKNAQGRQTGIDSRDAREVVKALGPKYEAARAELLTFQKNMLGLLIDSGVISRESAGRMEAMNQDYVPFHRVYERVAGASGAQGKGFVNLGQGVGRFKGSDRQIVDPLESIVKNAYVFRELAERNDIARSFVDAVEATRGGGRVADDIARKVKPTEVKDAEVRQALKDAGIDVEGLLPADVDLTFKIWRAGRQQSPKDGVFTVWKEGKEQPYQLRDPELHRALTLADAESMRIHNGLIRALFVWPTQALRAGATLTLEFMARNPFRDQVTAAVFSKHGFVPFFDGFRGLLSAIGKDQWYQDWQRSGGRYSDFVAMDRTDLQKTLADVVKEPNARALVAQLIDPRNILQNLRKFSELTEQATRISEFRRAKEAGATDVQAANASKDVTLNFARSGRAGKVVNQLVAFFNASVQDMDKFARAHREAPFRTTAKAVSYITVPSVLTWWLGKDDPEIQNLPDWRKNFFWNVNVRKLAQVAGQEGDDFVLSFPKPFLLGQIYGSSVERGLDYATGRDPNAVTKWFHNVLEITPIGVDTLLPTAMKPVVEATANYSFFRDQPIEGQGMQRLPAELRFNPSTSLVARELAALTPWTLDSPVKIDNTLRGYLGGLGKYGTDAADWLLMKSAIVDVPEPAAKTIWERPLLRGFASSPYEASAFVERFYNSVESAEQRINALRRGPELMTTEAMQSFARANRPDLAFYLTPMQGKPMISHLRAMRDEMAEVNKAMVLVQNSRDLTPATKAERLKALARARDQMAEVAFKTLVSPLDQVRNF